MKTETEHGINLPEQELLLALLGRLREKQDLTEIRSLVRQANWPTFLNTTSKDLYPYVAFALEPYVGLLEEPDLEPLSQARRLTAVQNLLLRRELEKVLDALRESGIPALALKGVVMAYTIYPDPSLRPMSDLDVLVPPGKREKAQSVVRNLGYNCPESMAATNRDHCWRLRPNEEFAPVLRLRTSMVLLEVHSELESSEPLFPISARDLWSRSVVVSLKGLRARTLCPEDFLFHICLHQSRSHRFEKGLLPLLDLRLLLDSRSDWNWAGIVERSVRCGFATWMYLTLLVAREMVGASVPDSFFAAISTPRDLPRLRCLAERQIWRAQSGRRFLFPSVLLAELTWRSRTRMFATRMRLVGSGELGSEPTVASFARLFIRRVFATLRNLKRRYVSTWKKGELNLRTIQRTARLLRESNTLFRLAEQDTIGVDHKPTAGGLSRTLLESSTSSGKICRDVTNSRTPP